MSIQKNSFMNREIWSWIGFAILLICIIWMKGQDITATSEMIWFVAGTIALLIARAIFLKRLDINSEKRKCLSSLFLLSPFIIFSVYFSDNIEIFGVLFFLIAIEAMEDNRKTSWILWFALAIGISEIYIFLFMLILLMYEKRVQYIIVKSVGPICMGGMLHLGISQFLSEKVVTGNIMWGDIIAKGIPAVAGQKASYFVIGGLVLFLICYFVKAEKKSVFYFLMVFSTLFLIIGSFQDYYVIIFVPLLLIVLFENPQYFRINMILYLVLNICGILCLIWNQVEMLINIPNISYYMGAVNACLVAAVLLLWFINYPRQKSFQNLAEMKCETWLKVLNIVIIYPLLLVVKIMG